MDLLHHVRVINMCYSGKGEDYYMLFVFAGSFFLYLLCCPFGLSCMAHVMTSHRAHFQMMIDQPAISGTQGLQDFTGDIC